MVQTRYKRPYSLVFYLALLFGLFTAYLVLVFTVGLLWWTWLIFAAMLVVGALGTIFDPAGIQHTRHLEDGTEVRVKRPLIGLKNCETRYGITGDYEVSSDGFRYESAIWVLHFHPLSLVATGEPVVWRG